MNQVSIRIFVEGIADQVFLCDLIRVWYTFDLDKKKFELKRNAQDFIHVARADNGTTDQSYAQTLREVSQTIDIPDFPFSTQQYLWPNNQVPGTLENLLETIINPENQPILDCWSSFEQCISSIPEKRLTLPADKTKIYAYLETLLGSTNSEKKKIKESNRDYTNTAHWNLDPNHKNLQPLKTFLDQHLLAQ